MGAENNRRNHGLDAEGMQLARKMECPEPGAEQVNQILTRRVERFPGGEESDLYAKLFQVVGGPV
jgi:hypothetical protein